MPTIEYNANHWGGKYAWSEGGDEWSAPWGGAEAQWFNSIFPRVHAFLPAASILEIAPGFGRWTQYLKDQCERLTLVDLNQNCIDKCKERFSSASHISFHVNDGTSLNMIPDNSIDFIYSFDSLVHAEADVIEAYLAQLERKLTPNGVGFIHHSNIGEFQRWWSIRKRLIPTPVRKYLIQQGLMTDYHSRAFSMTAKLFETQCERAGLQCISQETVNWRGKLPIDCFSLFTKKSSRWARPNRVMVNREFMREANHIAQLSSLYSTSSFKQL
jgi:SAM-dependent methyltransferase